MLDTKTTAILTAGIFVCAGGYAQNNNRPNILCILIDDLGYGDLSCYGATDIQTPNIDRLMKSGIKFNNFYANSPVSSPSRAALLTGRYPDMVGVPGVIRTHEDDSWGCLSEDAVLLPEVLKENGYNTAIVGKWHLGLETPSTPRERGFDYFKGFLGDMMDDYYNHLRWGNNYMRLNEEVIDPQGHATDLFSDWAIDYINAQKKETSPFFLYLAYNAPHVPVQPPQEWLDKVKKRQHYASEKRAKLAALIEHMDYGVGRVLSALEKSGKMDNTIVIFMSDNGGQADAGANNGPFRGAKEDMYEGGIHVAGGFSWPAKITPGQETDSFAMISDVFPTLCDAAGISLPEQIDGISILPLLCGEKQDTGDRVVYWVRREGNKRYGGQAYYASRYRNYKILQNTPWEPIQYFDIKNDPQETTALEKSGKIFDTLFYGQMEHIRQAGAVPWSKQPIAGDSK